MFKIYRTALCLFVFMLGTVLTAGDSPSKRGSCSTTPNNEASTLFIGHSLVNYDMPQMVGQLAADAGTLTEHHASHMMNGAPLSWNWANRFEVDFEGEWPPEVFAGDALNTGQYDTVIMTEGIPLATNIEWNDTPFHAGAFMDLARTNRADARVFLYETWHSRTDPDNPTPESWLARIVPDLELWEGVVDDVNAARPDAEPMYLVPAGQALRELIIRIEGGQVPHMSSRDDLFVDDIHMNDVGNYFIACIMYASIFRQSPEGLTHQTQDPWGGNYTAPHPDSALVFQQVAWQVVSNYDRNGFPCDDGGNLEPDGEISSPAQDLTVAVDTAVQFNGQGVDQDNHHPLTYAWDFGGGAPNTTGQNTTVSFSTPGTYTVTMTVTDSQGLPDPNPPSRLINVVACTPGVIIHDQLVQGVAPLALQADICPHAAFTWSWCNAQTGQVLATNTDTLILDPPLIEDTDIELRVTHPDTSSVYLTSVPVLVPMPELVDVNDDGCNTMADLYEYAGYWSGACNMDPDGDGVVTVKDLMYINISGQCTP